MDYELLLCFAVGFIVGSGLILLYTNQKLKALKELSSKNKELDIELGKKEENIENKKEQLDEKERDIAHLNKKLEDEKSNNKELKEENIKIKIESKSKQEILDDREKDIDSLKRNMKLEFKELAGEIFKRQTKEFSSSSKKDIENITSPLKERLKDLKSSIESQNISHAKLKGGLEKQIDSMLKNSKDLSKQTENLTNALKGSSKVQGDWGEMVLENILEKSGLIKDKDYTVQAKGLELKDSQGSKRIKPDIIINLPEKKHIIIDSKVSLKNYEDFISKEEEREKKDFLKKFMKSINEHIKNLSNKDYSSSQGVNSPNYVFMFIALEGAFYLAMREDRNLHAKAWDKKIVILTPTTLLPTLKIVAEIKRIERQDKNAQNIANKAGKLYDKFYNFLVDFKKIGESIEKAQVSYNSAKNKLKDGSGNIIKKAEELKELGIKSSKSIPKEI